MSNPNPGRVFGDDGRSGPQHHGRRIVEKAADGDERSFGRFGDLPRPFVSPLGKSGAWITIIICLVTLICQLRDALFLDGVAWVVVWIGLGIAYFLLIARHRLVLSPEEAAAIANLARRT